MHARLVSYLRDNRDHIIENWLTEAEIPSPQDAPFANTGEGIIPYTFFTHAFDAIVETVNMASDHREVDHNPQLAHFIGSTCECREGCFGGRICMELHDSGLTAFMSVFAEEWDTSKEFNELDRECCADLINHALSGFFGKEIENCPHRESRSDCPFAAHR
jgi:hypothetical protein